MKHILTATAKRLKETATTAAQFKAADAKFTKLVALVIRVVQKGQSSKMLYPAEDELRDIFRLLKTTLLKEFPKSEFEIEVDRGSHDVSGSFQLLDEDFNEVFSLSVNVDGNYQGDISIGVYPNKGKGKDFEANAKSFKSGMLLQALNYANTLFTKP